MTTATHTLAALLSSRICHDLVSPIGAISNGVELLQMSGTAMGPEIDLISESVGNANARIRFFRIAFGLATAEQRLGRSEIQSVLADATQSTRISVTWESDDNLPRQEVKLVFLAIQCFETAMPWGGEVKVTQMGDQWRIEGKSDRMKDIAPLWAALEGTGDGADVTAAQVQFLLLPILLADTGRSVELDVQSARITARI